MRGPQATSQMPAVHRQPGIARARNFHRHTYVCGGYLRADLPDARRAVDVLMAALIPEERVVWEWQGESMVFGV